MPIMGIRKRVLRLPCVLRVTMWPTAVSAPPLEQLAWHWYEPVSALVMFVSLSMTSLSRTVSSSELFVSFIIMSCLSSWDPAGSQPGLRSEESSASVLHQKTDSSVQFLGWYSVTHFSSMALPSDKFRLFLGYFSSGATASEVKRVSRI